MSDREMLELAAKAAGLKIHTRNQAERDALIDPTTASLWIVNGPTSWNPLKDDGDAFRLAIDLGVEFKGVVGTFARSDSEPTGVNACHPSSKLWLLTFSHEDYKDHDGDKKSATRRAIVRAAAEIGAQL